MTAFLRSLAVFVFGMAGGLVVAIGIVAWAVL
jgi:hypothetical protein